VDAAVLPLPSLRLEVGNYNFLSKTMWVVSTFIPDINLDCQTPPIKILTWKWIKIQRDMKNGIAIEKRN
jgi:hypothetical protein